MPQAVYLARLDGERRDDIARGFGSELGDTVSDRLAVLIEFVLPEEARQHRPAQSLLGVHVLVGDSAASSEDRGTVNGSCAIPALASDH